jgi:DtxR family Mn-dependent transcriptional regulator
VRISSSAEEVLEKLYLCTVEEKKSHVNFECLDLKRDDPAVRELLKLQYITVDGENINLTSESEKEAENVVRRHRLAERLLVDILHTKEAVVHDAACEFEHVLYHGIDEDVCTLLGHPSLCPHGKPIPPGRCCRETKKEAGTVIQCLTDVPVNQSGRIAYLQTADSEKFKKFMAMGILPGMNITLLQRTPSFVFKVENTQYAVDRELASDIYIRKT